MTPQTTGNLIQNIKNLKPSQGAVNHLKTTISSEISVYNAFAGIKCI